jgi:uncharacterized protein YegP (UPF0339 family)
MAGENDKWELYKDKRGEHRWRRKATNGNIVGAATEGYTKKADCVKNAQRHGMDGNPDKLGKSDKWEVYKDKRGEFRWRRKAANGNITGSASESYVKKADCEANAKRNGM